MVLVGLKQKPGLNGQMVQIASVDKATERYIVKCQNGKQIKVKYDKVIC